MPCNLSDSPPGINPMMPTATVATVSTSAVQREAALRLLTIYTVARTSLTEARGSKAASSLQPSTISSKMKYFAMPAMM